MLNIMIRLHNKNFKNDQKLTFEEFKNEFRPYLLETIDIYCGREKITNFDLDELLTSDTETVQKFLNKFKYYFNRYINCNWTFVGAVAYDKFLYGIKVYDYNKKSLATIISTWTNTFSNEKGPVYVQYATCVDYSGEKYNTEFENLRPYDDIEEDEFEELGLK